MVGHWFVAPRMRVRFPLVALVGRFLLEFAICPRGEMDITPVFGTVVPGSNPGEGT